MSNIVQKSSSVIFEYSNIYYRQLVYRQYKGIVKPNATKLKIHNSIFAYHFKLCIIKFILSSSLKIFKFRFIIHFEYLLYLNECYYNSH